MADLTCFQCGIIFQGKFESRRKKRFCGKSCYNASKPIPKHTCKLCGKVYFRTAKKAGLYCSTTCQAKSSRRKLTLMCLHCGSSYQVHRRTLKRGTKFCSRQCKIDSQKDNPEIPTFLEINCGICGKPFVAKWFAERGESGIRQRFCSMACRGRNQAIFMRDKPYALKSKPRVHCVCDQCGKDFTKYPSRAKEHKGTSADLCSKRCTGAYLASKMAHTKKRTDIEIIMANLLTDNGIPFKEQFLMFKKWTVDFFVQDWNLVIQCDGIYWHSLPKSAARDKGQNAYFKKCEVNLLRFTDQEIKKHPEACLSHILAYRPTELLLA